MASTEWLFLLIVEVEFGNVGFCAGRKTGVPREKPSEQGREPTTNSTKYTVLTLGTSVPRLLISALASDQDWVTMDYILKNCFQVLSFSFPKCTTAGHELVFSRIQLVSFS